MKAKLNLAILLSGSGTTMEAIIKACLDGTLTGINPVVVISSRPDALAVKKANTLGVPVRVVKRRDFKSAQAFGDELLKIFSEYNVDLVSQNGWLVLTPENVIEKYKGRIINQHPGALDPRRGCDFGGKGMYGARVVCATIAYTWLSRGTGFFTESTVHHVAREYDKGGLIRVVSLEVPGLGRAVTLKELMSDPDELLEATSKLQAELLPIEHKNVISVLQSFADGNIPTFEREKPLIPPQNCDIVTQAKALAIQLYPK